MALSINDILRDLGTEVETQTPQPQAVVESAETTNDLNYEKISNYLAYLATPDSVVDELAKLAVLQDFVQQNGITMDKVASLDIQFTDEKTVMLKAACELLSQLNEKVASLTEANAMRTEAEKLARKLSSAGHIDNEKILDKVAELSQHSREDLRALEKALELTKQGSGLNLGSLSETSSDLDPMLEYLLS